MKQKIIFLVLSLFIISCTGNKQSIQEGVNAVVASKLVHPDWSKDAVIYEVNIRQYTPEGTFAAFSQHLPRLKDLGVEILWIMPVHPIGVKNRKGELGSYYSVKDYKAVNPEYGSMEDFKALVKQAHDLDMKVIIDWVANHTAWDNSWISEHPEYYKKDSLGNFFGPFDWTDVAQLDYSNESLHEAMTDALEFWVKEADIDGYRCDVAGMVPVEFWEKARKALDAIKPVFMLAEDEQNYMLLEQSFDMNYAWEFHHIMNQIAKGEADVTDLKRYFAKEDSIYSKNCYRMQFITNHDENSWNGTEFERMGDAVPVFAVLTFTIPGMPLIYTGQEVGMKKRLEFFTKDAVHYEMNDFPEFYRSLIELKKSHKVLWNGENGGEIKILDSGDNHIFVFERYNKTETMLIILNLSPEQKEFVSNKTLTAKYTDCFTGEKRTLNNADKIILSPWEYKILMKK